MTDRLNPQLGQSEEEGSQLETGRCIGSHSIEMIWYYKENGGPSLYLVFEGRQCEIFFRPEPKDLAFRDGKNVFLVAARPNLRLTGESEAHLQGYIMRKERAAASDAVIDDHVGEFRERMDKIKYGKIISENPDIRRKMEELKRYFMENPYGEQGFSSSGLAFGLFYRKQKAGQILRAILEILEGKGQYKIESDVKEKKTPNRVLRSNGDKDLIEFFLKIAEGTAQGCGEKIRAFLEDRQGDQPALLILHSGNHGKDLGLIDSTFII